MLGKLGVEDPLLDIARRLEELALEDPYFVERKLYPNVDFYSGILMRAMGIPTSMFTVIFAIGRMPGWIAHWKEQHDEPGGRIARPRQIYTGPTGDVLRPDRAALTHPPRGRWGCLTGPWTCRPPRPRCGSGGRLPSPAGGRGCHPT